MRYILSAALVFFSTQIRAGEDLKTSVLTAFAGYYQALQKKDYGKMADYLHPSIYKLAPREAIIQSMKMMDNDEISFAFVSYNIERISAIFEEGGNYYAKLEYKQVMELTIILEKTEETDDEEKRAEFNRMLFETYKEMYGEDNVEFSETESKFIIQTTGTVYCIAPVNSADWKFLQEKPGMEDFLSSVIPKKTLKKLK